MGRTISCAKKSKKLRDARQATEGRGDMRAKLRPRKPASHHDLRPRRKVVYVYSDEDADETTDDSDEPYVPQTKTKTKTKTKTRTPRWEKKTTLTKKRTRRSRRPIEVELTYYECPSDRTRAIKVWGCKMPAPDRKQATQRRVYKDKLVDGFEVIGTYSDYRIKAMRTLDQPATAYRSTGRPYVARRGAKRSYEPSRRAQTRQLAKSPRVNMLRLTLFSLLDVRERQPIQAAQAPARRRGCPKATTDSRRSHGANAGHPATPG